MAFGYGNGNSKIKIRSGGFSMSDMLPSKDGREPIAIIGMGCRFPGDANDAASFWKLISTGVDAITEIPEDRWSIEKNYH